MENIMLDETDKDILRILQKNARISNVEIARKLKLAPSAVLKRIRSLETGGIIAGYETKIDYRSVGLQMGCFLKIHTDEKPGTVEVGRKIAAMPEVLEVHFMAADFYYLIKVREMSPERHADFIRRLGEAGVKDCHTLLILQTLKETLSAEIP